MNVVALALQEESGIGAEAATRVSCFIYPRGVGKEGSMVKKYGYYDHKDDVLARLRRVEGQVKGLQRMVEKDAYCIDVLTQITAASNALKKVAVALLDDHMRHCVDEAKGSNDMIGEATAAIERLVKS